MSEWKLQEAIAKSILEAKVGSYDMIFICIITFTCNSFAVPWSDR